MATIPNTTFSEWSETEKFVFRLSALYIFIQVLPLDPGFFGGLSLIIERGIHYTDIFNLSHYSPKFFGSHDTFANWEVVFGIALAGAVAWSRLDKTSKEYTKLYYWIRVIARYRLAIGIIAYGFIKFYPVQSPYPSLSNLNTNYGDFTRWKLFSLSLGIVPTYQSFLGLVEIVTGVLLLFRKTAVIGAFFILIFTGNVFISNLAYEGGQQVYSLYLIAFALFLLAYDLERIIRLLVLQKPTAPSRYKPSFPASSHRYARLAFKTLVIFFFVVLYGFKTRSQSQHGLTLYPQKNGLRGAAGIYNVAEFKRKNAIIPYSKTHPDRWQDVIFEQWNTISIKSNRPVIPDSNNVDKLAIDDKEKNYESEGTVGRQYFSYEVDQADRLLILHNKNPHYKMESLRLHYTLTPSKMMLAGVDQNNDSVFVVLNKIDRKYLVKEAAKLGRRSKLVL